MAAGGRGPGDRVLTFSIGSRKQKIQYLPDSIRSRTRLNVWSAPTRRRRKAGVGRTSPLYQRLPPPSCLLHPPPPPIRRSRSDQRPTTTWFSTIVLVFSLICALLKGVFGREKGTAREYLANCFHQVASCLALGYRAADGAALEAADYVFGQMQ